MIKNWSTPDGVPHNTVRAIVSSQNGYLWIGTANGLARFDGVRFVTFNRANTPDMVDDDIFSLYTDRNGTLWYRTRRGIGSYQDQRFEFQERPDLRTIQLLGVFAEDTDGTLWVHSSERLAKHVGDQWLHVDLPEIGPDILAHICAANDGGLWLAADNGLWRYRDGNYSLVENVPRVRRVVTGTGDQLWALVQHRQLYHYQHGTLSSVTDLGDQLASQLFTTASDEVWLTLGNEGSVLVWVDGELRKLGEHEGLLGNRALAVHQDPDGNIWSGWNAGGLYQIRSKKVTVYGRESGLLGLNTSSITQLQDGRIMLNLMGSTLYHFASNRFHPYAVRPAEPLYEDPTAVAPAREGGVWAGTYWGTLPRVVSGEVVQRIGSNAGTRSLFTDRDGNLWRGTRTAGVERFDGTNITRYSTSEGLSFNNVFCFAQDHDGAIWVGTENGLNRIRDDIVTNYGTEDGLGHHFISALQVDSRGTLWVGTLGGGLSGWQEDQFFTITTREGIAHNSIDQIIEDNRQHLWLGTRTGLMRIPVASLHEYLNGDRTILNGIFLGPEDGLPGANLWTEYQPATLRTTDGDLWFCTGAGVVKIDPEDFESASMSPVVHVENVLVDGRATPLKVNEETTVEIFPDNERIEIKYTGISFDKPAHTRFRYRLGGYDRDWIEAGVGRIASYAHLPPGHYTFQITAINDSGESSDLNNLLTFVVMPALWETMWFRGLLIMLLPGFLIAAYIWRVRGLERRQVAQAMFARRLIDSQEQERKRIAAELHDSLGQDMLVVRQLALIGSNAPGTDEASANQFNEISKTAGQALQEVRAISHALRPVELDRLGLTKSIRENIRRVGEVSQIRFDIQLDDIDLLIPPDQQINFYRIIQESLNNIVKHSAAQSASVEIHADENQVRLEIADDGCGFDAESFDKSDEQATTLGLTGIVERARALGGTVEIFSKPKQGSRIEIVIPCLPSQGNG